VAFQKPVSWCYCCHDETAAYSLIEMIVVQKKYQIYDVNMDHTIIVVNGFDDLLCNDHKMVTGYEVSSWSNGGDRV